MSYDQETLRQVAQGAHPVLRFFSWSRPAVSYGRLQRPEAVSRMAPEGWELVQRPTGGGVVFHDQDLCLSLAFRLGEPPLPKSFRELYAWIHGVMQRGLAAIETLKMATCRDCATEKSPFMQRRCFQEPVAFDLLRRDQKIVGGAFCRQGVALLYQGSIQGLTDSRLRPALQTAFEDAFHAMP